MAQSSFRDPHASSATSPSSGKARTSAARSSRASRSRKDEQALRAELRRQGVAPSKVRKQSRKVGGGKVKPEDIAVFSRQLATMLAAGIPLVQSFDIVGDGHDKPAMQKLILDIKADVEGGTSLHEALAQAPAVFRRPVREPGRGRRAGRCAREPARQGRHLQGKDRGAEEEGQEGPVLPGRGAGRRGRSSRSSC